MSTSSTFDLRSAASQLRHAVRGGQRISEALRPLADQGIGWLDLLRTLRLAFTLGMAEAGAVGGWRTGTHELSDADLDAALQPEIEALRPLWEPLDGAQVAAEPAAPATPDAAPAVQFEQSIPVLRIFDEAAARAFYVDFLGMQIDWEHRFEPDLPVYLQVSRGALVLHLTGHHGDACPGSAVYLHMRGVHVLQQELLAKQYKHARPGVQRMPWGVDHMEITDPFGNRLRFSEEVDGA